MLLVRIDLRKQAGEKEMDQKKGWNTVAVLPSFAGLVAMWLESEEGLESSRV